MNATLLKTPSVNKTYSPTATTFHTLGYEQSDPELFVELLQQNFVSLVVDVREMPLSRKRGFSKNDLYEILLSNGIDYIHKRALGAPKDLRELLKATKSWERYTKAYTSRVLSKQTKEVKDLISLAQRECICLVCFERNPSECHRSLVAQRMEELSGDNEVQVQHIRY